MKINKKSALFVLIILSTILENRILASPSKDWLACKQFLAGCLLVSVAFKVAECGNETLACLPIYAGILFIARGLVNYQLTTLTPEQKKLIFKLTQARLDGVISVHDYDKSLVQILQNKVKDEFDLAVYLDLV